MSLGVMVRRCAARDVSPWPVAAAVRHDESRVAVARRYAGPQAESWLDAAAREPHGTLVRQVAPWPEALQDEPSRAVPLGGPSPVVVPLDGPWQVVLPDGLLAQPRPLGRDLFLLGRTSRCSPRWRRHQEKTRQRGRRAEA